MKLKPPCFVSVLCGVLLAASVCCDAKPLKVLSIGNSYSFSAFRQTPAVAKACGCELDLCAIGIGGCTLERHARNIEFYESCPTSRPYGVKVFWTSPDRPALKGSTSIQLALAAAKWDVVTIQQASHASFQPDAYHPFGDKLVSTIRRLAPQAKIMLQETWSDDPAASRLKGFDLTSRQMYAALHRCYADFAKANGLEVIPTGTAVEFARDIAPLQPKDKKHLGPVGEYLQALTWTAALFKTDVTDCTYVHEGVTTEQAQAFKRAVVRAIKGELPDYVNDYHFSSCRLAVFGGSFSRIPASQVAKAAWRKALDCSVTDYGIGGCGFLAGAQKGNDILGQVKRAVASGTAFDAYVLWASTNDVGSKDVARQNAAIEEVVAYIRAQAPKAKIVFFASLPIPLCKERNVKLGEFAEGQIATCRKLGVPVLDLYAGSGITEENAAALTRPDKVHLTEAGYEKVKDRQSAFLVKHVLGK